MIPSTTAVNKRGVTLVELSVAMVSASILISIVFFTWNQINRSTTLRQRRTVLQSECTRLATMVTNQIKKAETVLQYDRNSLQLLMQGGEDTIAYSLSGTTIERNGMPLSYTMPGVIVAEFSFENQNNENEAQPYLFLFTLTLISAQNDTASVQSTVMGRRTLDAASSSGNDFMW